MKPPNYQSKAQNHVKSFPHHKLTSLKALLIGALAVIKSFSAYCWKSMLCTLAGPREALGVAGCSKYYLFKAHTNFERPKYNRLSKPSEWEGSTYSNIKSRSLSKFLQVIITGFLQVLTVWSLQLIIIGFLQALTSRFLQLIQSKLLQGQGFPFRCLWFQLGFYRHVPTRRIQALPSGSQKAPSPGFYSFFQFRL